jgi:hypothetical protein
MIINRSEWGTRGQNGVIKRLEWSTREVEQHSEK